MGVYTGTDPPPVTWQMLGTWLRDHRSSNRPFLLSARLPPRPLCPLGSVPAKLRWGGSPGSPVLLSCMQHWDVSHRTRHYSFMPVHMWQSTPVYTNAYPSEEKGVFYLKMHAPPPPAGSPPSVLVALELPSGHHHVRLLELSRLSGSVNPQICVLVGYSLSSASLSLSNTLSSSNFSR